jgi:hypothetical protein
MNDAAKDAATIKSLDKSISDLYRELSDRAPKWTPTRERPTNPVIEEMKALLKSLQESRKDIAKAQRLAKETCTREPARKLKSRGFGSIVRGLDGKIKLTKRAARLAADNDAGGTEK